MPQNPISETTDQHAFIDERNATPRSSTPPAMDVEEPGLPEILSFLPDIPPSDIQLHQDLATQMSLLQQMMLP